MVRILLKVMIKKFKMFYSIVYVSFFHLYDPQPFPFSRVNLSPPRTLPLPPTPTSEFLSICINLQE